MFFAHVIVEKFNALLLDNEFLGLVSSSNDGNGDQFNSYESASMDNIGRLDTPFEYSPDSQGAKGLYSTAFLLSMLRLRDFDLMKGEHTPMPAQSFNDDLLIPTCEWLFQKYSLPLQKLVVFSG